jgi:hypothetical protein
VARANVHPPGAADEHMLYVPHEPCTFDVSGERPPTAGSMCGRVESGAVAGAYGLCAQSRVGRMEKAESARLRRGRKTARALQISSLRRDAAGRVVVLACFDDGCS